MDDIKNIGSLVKKNEVEILEYIYVFSLYKQKNDYKIVFCNFNNFKLVIDIEYGIIYDIRADIYYCHIHMYIFNQLEYSCESTFKLKRIEYMLENNIIDSINDLSIQLKNDLETVHNEDVMVTLIIYSIINNEYDIADLLLKHGSDINIIDDYEKTIRILFDNDLESNKTTLKYLLNNGFIFDNEKKELVPFIDVI